MFERILAVVADEVEKELNEDVSVLDFASIIDPKDRDGRALGTLLRSPEDDSLWHITLFHSNGDVSKRSGIWNIRDIMDPHFLPECILLLGGDAALKELQDACNFWELDLKVYRVPGKLKTIRNPYPWWP